MARRKRKGDGVRPPVPVLVIDADENSDPWQGYVVVSPPDGFRDKLAYTVRIYWSSGLKSPNPGLHQIDLPVMPGDRKYLPPLKHTGNPPEDLVNGFVTIAKQRYSAGIRVGPPSLRRRKARSKA